MIVKFLNESKYAGWVLVIFTILFFYFPTKRYIGLYYATIELNKCGLCIVGMKTSGSKGQHRYFYFVNGKKIKGHNGGNWFSHNNNLYPVVYLKSDIEKSYMVFDQPLNSEIYSIGDTLSEEECKKLRKKVKFGQM